MYPEVILFTIGTIFVLFTIALIAYLLTSRKRNRAYDIALQQETELFDALTATLTQQKVTTTFSKAIHTTEAYDETEVYNNTGQHYPTNKTLVDGTGRLFPMDQNPTVQERGKFDPTVITTTYTIESEVTGGNMSSTFVVRNNKLGNPWFLKFISSKDGSLQSEENILKLLNHVGLPKIVDVYYRDEGVYLIETLIDGIPMSDLGEAKGKLGQHVLVDWFEQIAQTLNYLHDIKPYPVFHLDLKPGNIMITYNNRLVLVDFGISRHYGEGKAGAITASYAAPEQFDISKPGKYKNLMASRFGKLPPEASTWGIDARTDIYSLGVIMFELATGQPPIQENLSLLEDCVSHELGSIILKCLAIEPYNRYQSAVKLQEDLHSLKGSKIKMARALLLQRFATVAAIFTCIVAISLYIGGGYVFATENGASLSSRPDVVTVSLQQSTAFTIERHMPNGRSFYLDMSQIIWQASADNIAHIDGGRITGINEGETIITGRHRNNDVTLSVRVIRPHEGIIDVSQIYQIGREISVFAGTNQRLRQDGVLSTADFFSPESITATPDGSVYIADSGTIRRIANGIVETIPISIGYIAVDMVRGHSSGLYILTAPWQDDTRYYYALGRIVGDDFEIIYVASAVHTAIEDFVIGNNGNLYFILRNSGLGGVFLVALNTQDINDVNILTQLPAGSSSIVVADDGVIYIGNASTGIIQAFDSGELRNFAGLETESGFIDGSSPRFYMPQRLGYHDGYLYVWDFNTLRRMPTLGSAVAQATTIVGIASPQYNQELTDTVYQAENIILPHGRLMDFAITDYGILITDHKRGVVWRVD